LQTVGNVGYKNLTAEWLTDRRTANLLTRILLQVTIDNLGDSFLRHRVYPAPRALELAWRTERSGCLAA